MTINHFYVIGHES